MSVTSDPRNEATEFLEMLRPGGPWVLTAIIPDGTTDTITAQTADEARAFVATYYGQRNLYYSVNPTRKPMKQEGGKDRYCRHRVPAVGSRSKVERDE
jgi:hypothetical protein